MTGPACGWCGHAEPRDLLTVTAHATGRQHFVCRVSASADCFGRIVGPRAVDAIALLVPPSPEDLAALRAAVGSSAAKG